MRVNMWNVYLVVVFVSCAWLTLLLNCFELIFFFFFSIVYIYIFFSYYLFFFWFICSPTHRFCVVPIDYIVYCIVCGVFKSFSFRSMHCDLSFQFVFFGTNTHIFTYIHMYTCKRKYRHAHRLIDAYTDKKYFATITVAASASSSFSTYVFFIIFCILCSRALSCLLHACFTFAWLKM